jgi:hypothetical protein
MLLSTDSFQPLAEKTNFYCETDNPNRAYCMTLNSQITIPTLALQMKHTHHQTV